MVNHNLNWTAKSLIEFLQEAMVSAGHDIPVGSDDTGDLTDIEVSLLLDACSGSPATVVIGVLFSNEDEEDEVDSN